MVDEGSSVKDEDSAPRRGIVQICEKRVYSKLKMRKGERRKRRILSMRASLHSDDDAEMMYICGCWGRKIKCG